MALSRPAGKRIDWIVVGIYLFLLAFGWLNIYAASYDDAATGFDWGAKYGMQVIWISAAMVIALIIMYIIPARLYFIFSWWIYIFAILSLMAVLVVGKEINNSRSWIALGPFSIQPAEFSKIAATLALASLMEKYSFNFNNLINTVKAFAVMLLPVGLILLENETGLSLVYMGFLLCFYREGMSGQFLLAGILAVALFIVTLVFSPYTAMLLLVAVLTFICTFRSRDAIRNFLIGAGIFTALILVRLLFRMEALQPALERFSPAAWVAIATVPVAFFITLRAIIIRKKALLRNALAGYIFGVVVIFSADIAVNRVLQDYQRLRIESLLGIRDDPMGAGYNVHQSKIAIGSGAIAGKGFLHGTQTRFHFVPEQTTDFIFCTVGEEWGFLGALAVIICYMVLIIRIYNSAERQPTRFNRIYGYCTASCILMHVIINIGMTIGLMPVIGIPLPMLSYGGSSLLSFTIMIFIYLKLDWESRK